MWIKTENNMLVNTEHVTHIVAEELDTSLIRYEDTPWGLVCYLALKKIVIRNFPTPEEAEEALNEIYRRITAGGNTDGA